MSKKKTNGAADAEADADLINFTSNILRQPIVIIQAPKLPNCTLENNVLLHHTAVPVISVVDFDWSKCPKSEYKSPILLHFDGTHYKGIVPQHHKQDLPKLTKKFKGQKERAPLHTLTANQLKEKRPVSSAPAAKKPLFK